MQYCVISHRWMNGYHTVEIPKGKNPDVFMDTLPSIYSSVMFKSSNGGQKWAMYKKKGLGKTREIIDNQMMHLPNKQHENMYQLKDCDSGKFLSIQSNGWCCLGKKKDSCWLFEHTTQHDQIEVRVMDGKWMGSYLGIDMNGAVGAFPRIRRAYWNFSSHNMMCDSIGTYKGHCLASIGNGRLYCWNNYRRCVMSKEINVKRNNLIKPMESKKNDLIKPIKSKKNDLIKPIKLKNSFADSQDIITELEKKIDRVEEELHQLKVESVFIIHVSKAIGIPWWDGAGTEPSDPYVCITVCGQTKKTNVLYKKTDAFWNERLTFQIKDEEKALHENITIQMFDEDIFKKDDHIGTIYMPLVDFVERKHHDIFMVGPDDNIVVKKSRNLPMMLTLDVKQIPSSWEKYRTAFEKEEAKKFDKHVMLFTRGTRGDVQPFLALARGLANKLNWCITIVTELRWKPLVKRYKKLSKGRIRFRPSGGDTVSKIDLPIVKWAIHSTSELMQAVAMSRAELEFFDSEPVFYRTAEILKPDLIIFGFTVANIAMIVSERLKIPLIGFILQPTCIPSEDYTPIVPIATHNLSAIDEFEKIFVTHGFNKFLKSVMESNILGSGLNKMRSSRNLAPFGDDDNAWSELMKQNVPIICPMNPITFCKAGKTHPSGWSENAILTEFIFLQGGATPELADNFKKFIGDAKDANEPLVVITFSSMPVSRTYILEMAVKIIEECKRKPRIITLLGERDKTKVPLEDKFKIKIENLIKKGRLLEENGAPFSVLFQFMDCIIMHGGLGTTSESMRAGVPVICTGTLLMDQRFWGQQIENLGIGPAPVHISQFSQACVEYVNAALVDDSKWKENAVKLAKKIKPESPDGVLENIRAIQGMITKRNIPFEYPYYHDKF